MAKCNCGAQTCGCRLVAGAGVVITGPGTVRDPWVISVESGGGGESGWAPGDLKDTVRTVTDAGWLECIGQAVSRASYPSLFAAIGTTWGSGDGVSTFNIPNFAGIFRMGAGPGYPAGASGGTRETTLVTANLPPHNHSISHVHPIPHTHPMPHYHTMNHNHGMVHNHDINHTHTMAHTHAINHDHANATTTSAGAHDHDLAKANSDTNGTVVARGSGAGVTNSTGISTAGAHTHAVNIPSYTGVSGGASVSTTSASSASLSGGPSISVTDPSSEGATGLSSVPNTAGTDTANSAGPNVPNSGSTGSALAFSNLPPHRAVRVLIKT